VGLKVNGTHQLLVYADNVYPLEDNVNTKKKKTEALTDASHQNAGQNYNNNNKKMALTSF
jgi:hypothetical protein